MSLEYPINQQVLGVIEERFGLGFRKYITYEVKPCQNRPGKCLDIPLMFYRKDWLKKTEEEQAKYAALGPVHIKTPPAGPVQPLPRDKWPEGIVELAKSATPEDKGAGDTLARQFGWKGKVVASVAPWLANWLGKKKVEKLAGEKLPTFEQAAASLGASSCGCRDRQEWMNQRFPYTP